MLRLVKENLNSSFTKHILKESKSFNSYWKRKKTLIRQLREKKKNKNEETKQIDG